MKELKALLSNLDFSDKMSEAYLDLLYNGESMTGKICERTGIPSSHIYDILKILIDRGIISFKIINNRKFFSAANPDSLMNLLEEKKKGIDEDKQKLSGFIDKLKKITPEIDKANDFKYYKGIRGIKSLYTTIINSWKPGDEYFIASAPLESFQKLDGFFMDVVHKKRVKDKVKLRILINTMGKKYGLAREKLPLTQIRFLDMDTNTEYGVLNEYLFLVSYGKEPYGLLIKDANFARTYKAFFEMLWQNAKKNKKRDY